MSADDTSLVAVPASRKGRGVAATLVRLLVWSLPALIFVTLIGFWWAAVAILKVPPYLLPPPQDVLPRIVYSRESLWNHSLVTLQEILLGFGFSIVSAIPLGLLIALSPIAKSPSCSSGTFWRGLSLVYSAVLVSPVRGPMA